LYAKQVHGVRLFFKLADGVYCFLKLCLQLGNFGAVVLLVCFFNLPKQFGPVALVLRLTLQLQAQQKALPVLFFAFSLRRTQPQSLL
jgi:hypothetical protein